MTPPQARPSAEELAAMSAEEKRQLLAKLSRETSRKPPRPTAEQQEFPLAPAQQRLWFIDQLQPNLSVYTIPAALRLVGDINLERLRRCLNDIVARHEILRARFVSQQGEPSQVINPVYEFPEIKVHNDNEKSVREFYEKPFDLASGPLIRVRASQHTHDGNGIVLYIAIHHIIADYLSLRILLRELKRRYDASCHGERTNLPDLPIQYVDYAAWQERQQDQLEEEVQYWKRQLSDMPSVLKLPTDFSRPGRQSYRGDRFRFELPTPLSDSLKKTATEYRTTLFTVLLAALHTTLFRHTGQDDFCVGSTVSNRDREETRNLIGLFVNNVVFRAQPKLYQTFRELLAATHESVMSGLRNQQVPFERVVDALQIDRQLSHNPLFQVMFVLRPNESNGPNSSETTPQGGRHTTTFTPIEPSHVQSRFDLSLDISESSNGLNGFVEYSTDLFKEPTIRRFVEHFEMVLRAITSNSNAPIGNIPILTPEEQKSLSEWNDTSILQSDVCAHELFEVQAKQTPDATAVSFRNKALTYSELATAVDELVNIMREAGCKPKQPIAVCVPRGIEMLTSILAIMKLGAYYVPLDPSHPKNRRQMIIEDAAVQVILDDTGLQVLSPSHDLPEKNPERTDANLTRQVTATPQTNTDLAYLIYTSGSTGRPKGVPIQHRSLTNLIRSVAERIGISAEDKLLAVTTLAFDIATMELLLPLAVGATVIIADDETISDGKSLLSHLQTEATIMQATPATWRLVIEATQEHNAQTDRQKPTTTSVKMLCGGEALDLTLAKQLLAFGKELWNLYGPTETTIWSGVIRITRQHLQQARVPIGQPLANTEFHVLDEISNHVPIGVAGELFISGSGLSPGYHNRDELTHERFVRIPKLSGDNTIDGGQTLAYATGDRVRYLEDGTLEFLGRFDHQIKLRGFRIELGEIESQLIDHDEIDNAIVTLQDQDSDARLVAYCKRKNPESPENDLLPLLREHLNQRLPAYMAPTAIVLLDEFPITPNGKVDHNSLLSVPVKELSHSGSATFEELSEVESTIAGIWSDLLNRPINQPALSFFEIGGHSLLAARMIARIQQQFSIELPLRTIFDHPSLREFARFTESATSRKTADAVEPGPASTPSIESTHQQEANEPFASAPLTHAQQRQWILAQLDPENPAYNIPAAVKVSAKLSEDQLKQALFEICNRHDVLHTAFVANEDDRPRAEFRKPQLPNLYHIDLTETRNEEKETRLNSWLANHARQPFDLSHSPLMRVAWAKLDDDQHVVMLVLHHIVGDAWSLRILLNELAKWSTENRKSLTFSQPKGGDHRRYIDFARENQTFDSSQSRSYWNHQLGNAPSRLDLPTDFARTATPTFSAGEVYFDLDARTKSQLDELSLSHQTTLYMTLLTAFKLLLARYSNTEDIVVGSPVGHRPSADLEETVGLFVNTLAFRSQLNLNDSFVKTLRHVRKTVLDGLEHQEVPFEQIVSDLDTQRDWDHSPIFQVMFLWQNDVGLDLPEAASQQVKAYRIPPTTTKFDLTLSMAESKNGLTGRIEYRSDLFHQSTMQSLADAFTTLLTAIILTPDRPVGRLELSDNENLSEPIANLPKNGDCLHHRFAVQVRKNPNSVALVQDDRKLTYAELDAQANKIALALKAMGVGAESRVGVCLKRTTNLVVAILGVLKADAAYVPIDPAYPQNRINFMLEDSRAKVVIRWNDGLSLERTSPLHEKRVTWFPADPESDSELNAPTPTPAYRSEEPVGGPLAHGKPTVTCRPANAAYIIYTSGSTGTPKGVVIEHRSAVALVDWATSVFSTGELSGVLASTSICFDLSVFELFVPLCSGGTVVLVENALAEIPHQHPVTLINTVPSAATELASRNAIPHSVTTINLAGEPLSKQLVSDLYRHQKTDQPAFTIHNLYGPSEDTTYSTFARMDLDESGATSPIGHAVGATQAFVLDDYLNKVPSGFPGELYLAGEGVARGYWNRSALTAEVFLPNPFRETGQPMYRTGDRVRRRYDGQLEFLGRIDDQIKLRGFRIELGEIEQVLTRHPDIKEAVASVVTVDGGSTASPSQQLVAYLVNVHDNQDTRALSPSSSEANKFREFLRKNLPDHMIPSLYAFIPSVPLLPNGKINRKALRLPKWDTSPRPVPPTNDIEQTLHAIWRDLLGRDGIGITDNFFSLGGDSIIALQMISRAGRDGLKISPRDVFQHPTINQLAVLAERLTNKVPPKRLLEQQQVPLTPIQRWFFHLPLEHPAHWNQSLLVTVNEELHVDKLRDALRVLAEQHPVLGASFKHCPDGWQQTWNPPTENVPLEVVRCETSEVAKVVHESATKAQAAFQLDSGPLWKVVYFDLRHSIRQSEKPELPQTKQPLPFRRLLVVCHHLLVDGVSWRILFADLQFIYQQLVKTGRTELMPSTTSVTDWVHHLEEHESFIAEDEYWQHTDQNINASSLPLDVPHGHNSMRHAKTHRVQFGREHTQSLLSDVPQQFPIRIEELLIAALAHTVANWSGRSTVPLQLERHGRIDHGQEFDLSRTVGWLTSMFPVIVPVPSHNDLEKLIIQAKEALRRVPSDGAGYGVLRWGQQNKKMLTTHDPVRSAPAIRFNYLGQSDQLFSETSLFSPAHESTGAARHPDDPRDVIFEINAVISDGRLSVHWTYGSELYHAQTIHKLVNNFRKSVLALIRFCLSSSANSGYTESDFPQMDFEPGELDDLLRDLE